MHWLVVMLFFLGFPAWAQNIERVSFPSTCTARNPAVTTTLNAEVYKPASLRATAPAVVILNSSGGVRDDVERFYARNLSTNGFVVLVVDSFTSRNVQTTGANQMVIPPWCSVQDAYWAWRYIITRSDVDTAHIGLTGMSRGGYAVVQSMVLQFRERLGWRGDEGYAAFVAIVPSCQQQFAEPRTVNRPLQMFLAERDDLNSARQCVEYGQRLRRAGNNQVSWTIFPRANHGFEILGEHPNPTAENWDRCPVLVQPDWSVLAVNIQRTFPPGLDGFQQLQRGYYANCLYRGSTVGSNDPRIRQDSAQRMLRFFQRYLIRNGADVAER